MKEPIAINKLAKELGLTSRTLRHWEAEGLCYSGRDEDSGWRLYGEEAVFCIRITSLLRKFGIPIPQIRIVLQAKTTTSLLNVLEECIKSLQTDRKELTQKEEQLIHLKTLLEECITATRSSTLAEITGALWEAEQTVKKEGPSVMSKIPQSALRIIMLPPMRTVYHIAVSTSPEDEAMEPVIAWLKAENLLGTARLFGGNMPPMPCKEGEAYGYGMCAVIPETAAIPAHLKEMRLPGGLYAAQECGDDVPGSWKTLMDGLSQNQKYQADHKRLCFEEHVRNDTPEGSGNEYSLVLLEPVKAR